METQRCGIIKDKHEKNFIVRVDNEILLYRYR